MDIKKDEQYWLEKVALLKDEVTSQIDNRIVGQKKVIDLILTGVLANGHLLLVGVPGLAKTMLVNTVCDALDLQFGRIQFTPDLMPSDITGTEILEQTQDGKRSFQFLKGPVFCNLLLADELNRTPPKTQAALLQAMQENIITAGGRTYELPKPFLVLATQNPIEQGGTYPLPEAQLDRFMFQIVVDYPDANEEIEIIKRTTVGAVANIKKVVTTQEMIELQKLTLTVPCADHIIESAVNLVRNTRPEKNAPAVANDNITWGAGPRAAQMLVLAAKASTLLDGRFAVDIEDVKRLAKPVLRHRIVRNFEAEAKNISTDSIIDELVALIL